MAAEIDIARNMLYNVCRMKDEGLDYIAEAAAVKVFASEMCVRISEEEQHHRAAELILQKKACPNLD